MIVVTGAAGFISSNLISKLNKEGKKNLILVDDFDKEEKKDNFKGKNFKELINRDVFFNWLKINGGLVDFVFHLGARTDTTEFDVSVFDKLNLNYSKQIWEMCAKTGTPLIYASSAATYGMGEHGYKDNHKIVKKLAPLNPYGESKNEFDKWVLEQRFTPPFWAGIKFFNVYGPNEYHKGRMASVIFHAFNQINNTGKMKLFRSHNPDFNDGEQQRDFIYVKDVLEVLYFLYKNRPKSGLYNLGTGKARTFVDLTKATFAAMQVPEIIEFVDTPKDIRDKYQYYTEANIKKLKNAGYKKRFTSLEKGVKDYVQNFLIPDKYN